MLCSQSSGMASPFIIRWFSLCNHFATGSPPAFSSSAVILSAPGAFSFGSDAICFTVSSMISSGVSFLSASVFNSG